MPKLKFTKEVVVEAGYELMKKKGFQNVSVRKIAKPIAPLNIFLSE